MNVNEAQQVTMITELIEFKVKHAYLCAVCGVQEPWR